MAWIEVHQSLLRHPKTGRAALALGIDRYKMTGHLVALWCWALDAKPDGGPLDDIDVRLGTDLDSPDVLSALASAGFLDEQADGYWIHEWDEYAGRLMQRRAANKERMRSARATHVQRTSRARAGATVPNLTVPNRTEPEERDTEQIFEIETELRMSLGIMQSNLETLRVWAETYTIEEIRMAIGKAREAGKRTTAYVDGILRNEREESKQRPRSFRSPPPKIVVTDDDLLPGQRAELAAMDERVRQLKAIADREAEEMAQ